MNTPPHKQSADEIEFDRRALNPFPECDLVLTDLSKLPKSVWRKPVPETDDNNTAKDTD